VSVKNTIKGDRILAVIREEIGNEMNAMALQLVGLMQRSLRETNSIATGLLVGSMQSEQVQMAGSVISLRVGTPVEYGAYVERDTAPHWAPIRPLYEWVERKLNVVALNVKFEGGKAKYTGTSVKQFGSKKTFSRAREIYRVAKLIQYKIAHEGTKGKFFMRDSLDRLGLTYEVREDEGEMVYAVDIATWIENRGQLWTRVEGRLSAETT